MSRKVKQQTSDPGQNHSTNSKNGGQFEFDDQNAYDVPGDELESGAPVSVRNTSNKFNGSGGSRRVIAPGKVKGINP